MIFQRKPEQEKGGHRHRPGRRSGREYKDDEGNMELEPPPRNDDRVAPQKKTKARQEDAPRVAPQELSWMTPDEYYTATFAYTVFMLW